MVDWQPQLGNVPLGIYADVAQKKAQLEQNQQEINNRNLQNTISNIGTVASSLAAKRMQVAQALAQSNLYKQMHPELFAPTTKTTTDQAPVMRNQTAAYDPATGSVTPNTDMSGVGAVIPMTKTTTLPPVINDQMAQTLPSLFMGLAPKDFLDSADRSQANKIQQGELDLKRQYEPEHIKAEQERAKSDSMLRQMALRFQGMNFDSEDAYRKHQIEQGKQQIINDLLSKKEAYSKDLATGYFNSINNDKDKNARKAMKEIDAEISRIRGSVSTTNNQGETKKPSSGGWSYVGPAK